MKKLAILGIIFLGFNSFAQDLASENIDQNNVLYRGFENKIVFDQIGDDSEEFQMEAINCEVSKSDRNENTYTVKTRSKARTAKINFISNGQISDSATFIVQNLPVPSLIWGHNITGGTISNSKEIRIKYSPGIALESNFEIVSWNCSQKDAKFDGQGNQLSQEMLDHTKSMTKGEFITIEVKVKGVDGVIRKLSGSWEKK